jgi:oligosaccharide repeat unit polymerase
MTIIIILLLGVVLTFLSKHFFGKWFNHMSLMTFIWTGMLFLYELKLLRYFSIQPFTWFIILGAFFSFIVGSLTLLLINRAKTKDSVTPEFKTTDVLADEGRTLKIVLYITGLIGLFAAIQNWYILYKMFGNLGAIFLSANTVYRGRVDGKIEGLLPYYHAFATVGICLAGLYTAYKNKITLAAIIPLFAAILKSLAMFGRIGMLAALIQFFTSYILAKQFLSHNPIKIKVKFKSVVAVIVVLALIVGAASVVKSFRGVYERYRGASPELYALRTNPFFSPSVYLYLSGNIGVLNKYLEEGKEKTVVGENTFAAFFNLFEKFGITERVPYDLRGYHIPMWTNTGTYLRDLHLDYGVFGIFLVPYLLGLFLTYHWIQFYARGKLFNFVVLVQFTLIVGVSFFSLITRGAEWVASTVILMALAPYLEKLAVKRSKEKLIV